MSTTHRTKRRVAALASGAALVTLLGAPPAGAGVPGLPVVSATSESAALL
ncbi:hypothetical protein ACIBMX_10250 [Streptomyces phaeochromogenes]